MDYYSNSTESPIFERFKANYSENHFLEYFSMINEVITCLALPLEKRGYILDEKTCVDISFGKGFCNYLRKVRNIEPNEVCITYTHKYRDGREVQGAKLYPQSLKLDFISWFKSEWIAKKAKTYLVSKEGNDIVRPLNDYIEFLQKP